MKRKQKNILIGAGIALCAVVAGLVLWCVLCVGRQGDAGSTDSGDDDSEDVLRDITDISFLTYCTSQLHKWDTDGDEKLSPSEARGVKTISIMDRGIYSLAGLEHFTGLEMLDCRLNNLSQLDVSKNTALATLWCDMNRLTCLDISSNESLTELSCAGNPGNGASFCVTLCDKNTSAHGGFDLGIWTNRGVIITPEFL